MATLKIRTFHELYENISPYTNNHIFSGTDFIDANLTGASLKSYKFVSCDFRAATLKDVDDILANFRQCDLIGVKFSGCTLLKNTQFVLCVLPAANFILCNLIETEFVNCDLTDNTFRDCDLIGVKFVKCDLIGANLSGCNLTRANLSGCNLTSANLSGCNLTSANFRGATLLNTDFRGATLRGAILIDTEFVNCDLTDADFRGCNLTRVKFVNCNLTGANLSGCNLTMANLSGCNLTRANFRGCNLTRANLSGCNLTRANFRGCNLTSANFSGTTLLNTDFRGATLIGAILIDVIFPNNITDTAAFILEAILDETSAHTAFREQPTVDTTTPYLPPADDMDNAYEIHRSAHALLSNNNFLEIIGALNPPSRIFDYAAEKRKMKGFITMNPEQEQNELNRKIDLIWEKVQHSTPTPSESKVMCKATEFAYKQKPAFISAYISTFIDEAAGAYQCGDQSARLSCTQGIRERFYTSLLGAASIVLTMDNFEKTKDIISLDCISKLGNIQKDPNEVIKLWSDEMTNNPEKWVGTYHEKIENFKNFMRNDYNKDDCYEINKETIEDMINKKAREIDSVFEMEGVFRGFGGNKTKKINRKTQKKKKNKSNTKNKNKNKNKKINKNKTKNKTKTRMKTNKRKNVM